MPLPKGAPTVNATDTPSLTDLVAWLSQQRWSRFARSLARSFYRFGRLSPRQEQAARSMYAKMKGRGGNFKRGSGAGSRNIPSERKPEIVPGMYEKDGMILRVRRAEAGFLYAMRYIPEESDERNRFAAFRFMGGLANILKPEDRMTFERAKLLGHMWGQCCVCGRNLTASKSIEEGIGPICAANI